MTQQPYAPAPPMPPVGPPPSKGHAVGAMVCGILGLLMFCLPVAGPVLSLIGTCLGGIALKKGGNKGIAVTGLVCGIVGLIAGIIMTISYLVAGQVMWDLGHTTHGLQTMPSTAPGPVPMP